MGYLPDQPYGWIKNPRRLRQGVLVRQCTTCKGEFPNTAAYFYRKAPTKGLLARCKGCKKAERAKYGREHNRTPETGLAWQRRTRLRRLIASGKPPAPRHFWTTYRVAAEIGTLPEYVCLLARRGRIPAVRHLGRYWRFDPAEIARIRGERDWHEYAIQAAD